MKSLSIARYLVLLYLALLFAMLLDAQPTSWEVFNKANSSLPDNQVHAIVIDKHEQKWIGTANGLAKLNGNNWSTYNTSNSPLPSSFITTLMIDNDDRLWIGTDKGLAILNNGNWTVFTSQNSPLANHVVNKIIYDKKNNVVWISNETQLLKYDHGNWIAYDDSNSYIFESHVINSLAADKDGVLWLGLFDLTTHNGRLLRFDGTKWSWDKLDNHGMTSSFAFSLAFDEQGALWMGVGGTSVNAIVRIKNNQWTIFDKTTSSHISGAREIIIRYDKLWFGGNGFTIYDGLEWTGFNAANSDLPDDYVHTLAVDDKGNAWIGTISGGVAVYKTRIQAPSPKFFSFANYPNPFSRTTTISYKTVRSARVKISIYNAAGQFIKTIQDELKQPGSYTFLWNAGELANGIYFCRLSTDDSNYTGKLVVQR